MHVNFGMDEAEFIDAIDGNFLFDTDHEYEDAARIACKISDNAALMVGYELARGGSIAPPEVNLAVLDVLAEERDSAVVQAAVPVVRSLLAKESAAPQDVRKLLAACKEHSSAWSGLGIVLCADESLEPECEEIMSRWRGSDDTAKES
jgi:hypothetical protein